jgi:hypothetical protein
MRNGACSTVKQRAASLGASHGRAPLRMTIFVNLATNPPLQVASPGECQAVP